MVQFGFFDTAGLSALHTSKIAFCQLSFQNPFPSKLKVFARQAKFTTTDATNPYKTAPSIHLVLIKFEETRARAKLKFRNYVFCVLLAALISCVPTILFPLSLPHSLLLFCPSLQCLRSILQQAAYCNFCLY